MSFIYLASPYSHPSTHVRHFRMIAAASEAAKLTDKHTVYSPVLHGHHLEMFGMAEVKGHDFWMNQCLNMLECASEMHVLCLDGWRESNGVSQEIEFAHFCNIPIFYIDI